MWFKSLIKRLSRISRPPARESSPEPVLAAASEISAVEAEPVTVRPDIGLQPDLARIIRPEVQQRWLLPQLAAITPRYIENILRGAMAGAHIQQWELFELMEDTWPRLMKNLNEVKRAASSMSWKLEAWAEEDMPPTATALAKQKTVSRAVWTMKPRPGWDENAFTATIIDILDAWGKGTSVLEIDWELRGDIWAPRSTYWVHPRNYGWTQEGYLGLIRTPAAGPMSPAYQPNLPLPASPLPQSGLLPSNVSYGAVEFPEDKFLVAICKAKSGHPLSGALLRPLAWWWCAMNFSADWLLNFAQVFGLPFRWANYDPNAPQSTIDAICQMLANMGSNGWAAFPAGTTLELKEGSKGGENSTPAREHVEPGRQAMRSACPGPDPHHRCRRQWQPRLGRCSHERAGRSGPGRGRLRRGRAEPAARPCHRASSTSATTPSCPEFRPAPAARKISRLMRIGMPP